MEVISTELAEIRDEFATERRSVITFDAGEIDIEDLIDDEELVVTLSANGYVKTVQAGAFRTQGRGGRGVAGAKLRDGDYVTHVLATTAHAYLLFFSTKGKVYRLKAHEIPMKDRTARGTAMINLLPLENDERIEAIIDTRDYETSRYLFFATKQGQVKKTKFTEYDSSRRDGIIAIKLKEGDELRRVIQTTGEDDIFLISRNGQTLRFSEDKVRSMGRSAAGVRGIKLKEGDELRSCCASRPDADLLITTQRLRQAHQARQVPRPRAAAPWASRASSSRPRRARWSAPAWSALDDEVILVSSGGVIIRTAVREISAQGRDASGVRIMNLDGEETLVAVAPVLQDEDDAE